MTTQSEPVLEAGGLRVEFHRAGDRWEHAISLLEGGEFVAWLKSVEGSPDKDWPESPPLQELSVEEHGGRTVLLLVGMAGASHWSMSLEMNEHGRATFECACRCNRDGHPDLLRSTYRLPRGARSATGLFGEHFCVQDKDLKTKLIGQVFKGARIDCVSGLRWCVISAPRGNGDHEPRTVRWSYIIEPSPTVVTPP